MAFNEQITGEEGRRGSELEAKMAELVSTKDELKRARDNIMQSWLDSRPLIDELERRKSGLRIAEHRCSSSDDAVAELNSQLETTYSSITSKKEELVHAKNTIDELRRNSDRIAEEIKTIRRDSDDKRTPSELGRVVKLRRQTLRRLRLHLRAAKLESEAFESSRDKAESHLNSSKQGNVTFQLTHEEFYALVRKAAEQSSIPEWHVAEAMERKDHRRNSLLQMDKMKPRNRTRKRRQKKEEQVIGGEDKRVEVYENMRVEEIGMERRMKKKTQKPLKEIMEKSSKRNPPEKIRIRPASNSTRRTTMMKKNKKISIFFRIRSFFMRSISRLFG